MIIQKLKRVILEQLTQGATPHGLAMTCGFALSLGLFPVLGSTTLLCLLFGVIFKLNQPLIQALNYLLYPLQIIFIPIFLYIGESILNVPHLTIRPLELVQQISVDWKLFLAQYGMAGLQAVFAWVLLAPASGVLLYFLIRPILEKLNNNKKRPV